MLGINWSTFSPAQCFHFITAKQPEKLVVKLQSACFEKLTFLHVFNIRKTKRIAKFDGLEPRRYEDIKGIVTPEIDPKSFGTFEKRAAGQKYSGLALLQL